MRRIAGAPVSREAQEHVSQAEPPVLHEGGVIQGVLKSMGAGKAREGERLTGAGHGHVVQPTRGGPRRPAANPVPATVQHNNVVELQALGAMGSQQQQDALSAACVTPPLLRLWRLLK